MGRDLKVRFFKDVKEYNNGDYNYDEHRDDFSLNGARNTDWPWYWSGSRMDAINEITQLASKIVKLESKMKDHLASEFVDEDISTDEYYYSSKIERKAKELSNFALVLSECPTYCDYIVITND